jgi:hypothetical protein
MLALVEFSDSDIGTMGVYLVKELLVAVEYATNNKSSRNMRYICIYSGIDK